MAPAPLTCCPTARAGGRGLTRPAARHAPTLAGRAQRGAVTARGSSVLRAAGIRSPSPAARAELSGRVALVWLDLAGREDWRVDLFMQHKHMTRMLRRANVARMCFYTSLLLVPVTGN